MKEEQIKHLEFIQSIITRINTNSFHLKGLAITIISALLALYVSINNSDFLLISIFSLIIFWFLDAYYLTQERRFRGLYNDIINENEHDLRPFEMRPDLYKRGRFSFWSVLFSRTIWPLYFSVIAIILIIYLLM